MSKEEEEEEENIEDLTKFWDKYIAPGNPAFEAVRRGIEKRVEEKHVYKGIEATFRISKTAWGWNFHDRGDHYQNTMTQLFEGKTPEELRAGAIIEIEFEIDKILSSEKLMDKIRREKLKDE